MRQDLRFALRMIAAHPWFSAAVVATLALGIGLNTMVFTLINAALFKPVPVPGGERLVCIRNQNLTQGNRVHGISYPDFREYRAQSSTFESLEAAASEGAIISEKGNPPQHYSMDRVSAGMFTMLHVQPILGRTFLPADEKAGAEEVVLLSYRVWEDRYGSSPSVIGHPVRVNGKPATIIGVMPRGFQFPNREDLWMVITPFAELESRTHRPLQLFGILKQGTALSQGLADLEAIARRLASEYSQSNKGISVVVETFHQRYNGGNIRSIFVLMMGAVGFVLLIACANIANMMLSRALGRQREISIRVAMGASRWQIVRQLLVESVLLSITGGILGLGLAVTGVYAFDLATQDVGKPYWVQFTMDFTVFGYFAGLCIVSGLLFGLVPAIRSSRVDLNTSLKDGARSVGTQSGGRISQALVVLQLALTLVLLTGAGIFVRGFLASQNANSWIPADRILTAHIRLPQQRYDGPAARYRFVEQLLPAVASLPGVTHVVVNSDTPGLGAGTRRIQIEHTQVTDGAQGPSASVVSPSPGYFDAIQLPMLSGRDFVAADGSPGRESVIVSKEFAERHWPGVPALGKRLRFNGSQKPGEWMTVIGVTANMVQQPNASDAEPLIFIPYRLESSDWITLLVRTAGNPASFAPPLRAAVQQMDQDLPLFDVRTLVEAVERSRWYLRVFGTLFLIFAIIALVIASVGIYAVIAQATARRTQEIGVRMALGATARNILGLVLSRGLLHVGAGLAVGLAAAYPATRLMTSLPLGVSASDPLILLTVSLGLAAVGLFACWLPARRAARLHPLEAIRYE